MPDEPSGFDADELAEAVPGRVSESGDGQGGGSATLHGTDQVPTLGPGAPAFSWSIAGGLLAVVAVLALVAVLLLRAGGPPPSPEEVARQPLNPKPSAPPSGPAALGEPVYRLHCAQCHGIDGDGGIGPSLRSRRVALAPEEAVRIVIRRGIGTMPPVALLASDEDAVLAYLAYLQGR